MPKMGGWREAVNLLSPMRVVKQNLHNLHQSDAFLDVCIVETPNFAPLACSNAQLVTTSVSRFSLSQPAGRGRLRVRYATPRTNHTSRGSAELAASEH